MLNALLIGDDAHSPASLGDLRYMGGRTWKEGQEIWGEP